MKRILILLSSFICATTAIATDKTPPLAPQAFYDILTLPFGTRAHIPACTTSDETLCASRLAEDKICGGSMLGMEIRAPQNMKGLAIGTVVLDPNRHNSLTLLFDDEGILVGARWIDPAGHTGSMGRERPLLKTLAETFGPPISYSHAARGDGAADVFWQTDDLFITLETPSAGQVGHTAMFTVWNLAFKQKTFLPVDGDATVSGDGAPSQAREPSSHRVQHESLLSCRPRHP